MEMGCFGCFGFSRRHKAIARPSFRWGGFASGITRHKLLGRGMEEEDEEEEEGDEDDDRFDGESTSMTQRDENDLPNSARRSEVCIDFKIKNGLICRQFQVKETCKLVRCEDDNGNKMINEYVRERRIGAGAYAKVVLYRSSIDGIDYAIKAFHKSHLIKQRVAPSETAMTDVLREVLIMKIVCHPNIVNLIEVIDDPDSDHFYMVLEYVEEKWDHEGSGPPGGLGEATARKYLRDIVSGLMYLHSHNIVHMDIKPQNLLVTRDGNVKIADFSVSQVFEGDNDDLRRSPGTPVITAPECCLGISYRGRAADTWAVGITLHCMIMGSFPFIGETLQDTYDKIVNDPLDLPNDINPQLEDLLEGLLCKDPKQRMTLEDVAEHPWVLGENGPLPEFLCWCKRNGLQRNLLGVGVDEKTRDGEGEF